MKLPEVKPIMLHKTRTPGAYEVLWEEKNELQYWKPATVLNDGTDECGSYNLNLLFKKITFINQIYSKIKDLCPQKSYHSQLKRKW